MIATWSVHDGCRMFQEMYGQVFGRAAAVINFHRVQRLLVAMIRRWLLVLCSMYYDDASFQDLAAAKGRGQRYIRALFRIVGLPLAESKQVDLNGTADFLRMTHEVADALQTCHVLFTPRAQLLAKAVDLIQQRLQEDSCTPAQVSKVRGVFGFLFRCVRPSGPRRPAPAAAATAFRYAAMESEPHTLLPQSARVLARHHESNQT